MIYLDNSATTSKKPTTVKKLFYKAIKNYSFNPGRSGHKGSIKAGIKIIETREKIARFFNAKSLENIIFTNNCTSALNLAILGSIKYGGHIVTTYQEHNSVLRTLFEIKKFGVTHTIAKPKKRTLQLTTKDILKKIKSNTYMVIVNQTSNVTGNTLDISRIGEFCHKNKILFLVDSAQSAGHEKIDVRKQHINLLACAGHKGLYGPQGTGFLIVNNTKLKPIIFGGTGTNSEKQKQPKSFPDGFEAGTLSTPNIVALYKGVEFVENNFDKINFKIELMTKLLIDSLKTIPEIILYSTNNKSGVVSFNIEGLDSTEVGEILNNKFNICVRCGLHCAPLVHKQMKTLPSGSVRISMSFFNTINEIKKTLRAIIWICNEYLVIKEDEEKIKKLKFFEKLM